MQPVRPVVRRAVQVPVEVTTLSPPRQGPPVQQQQQLHQVQLQQPQQQPVQVHVRTLQQPQVQQQQQAPQVLQQQQAPQLLLRQQAPPEVLHQPQQLQQPPVNVVYQHSVAEDPVEEMYVQDPNLMQPLSASRVFRAPAERYAPAEIAQDPMAPRVVYQAQSPVVRRVLQSVTVPAVSVETYPVDNGAEQYYDEDDIQLGQAAASYLPAEVQAAAPAYDDRAYVMMAGGYDQQVDEADVLEDAEHMQLQQQLAQQPGDSNSGNQLTSLLESLEARVDLMAQMQHTRAAIQKRANAIQEMRVRQHPGMLENGVHAQGLESISGTSVAGYEQDAYTALQDAAYTNEPTFQEEIPLQQQEGDVIDTEAAARLAQENQELWFQFQAQKDMIGKLTGDIEGMRQQLTELSTGSQLPAPPTAGGAREENGPALIGQPMSYPCSMSQAEIVNAFGNQVPGKSGGPTVAVDVIGEEMRVHLRNALDSTQDAEVRRLEQQLADERQRQELATLQRLEERERLHAELQEARIASAQATPDAGLSANSARGFGFCSPMDSTAAVTPVQLDPGLVSPFDSQSCGVNVALSEDGYIATRTRGCRQSVVVGSEPLSRQAQGWYFEVVIRETVSGWVGGLGIGVTSTSPGNLTKVPDKAWRIPSTFVVGYWGCIFLNGTEQSTDWRADTLQAGARVGLLVTSDEGDLVIFVDDEPVAFCQGALRSSGGFSVIEPLYPVVDVFAATRVVSLSKQAFAPAKPWKVDAKLLPPPGAPMAVPMRTTSGMSTMSALSN